MKGVLKMSDGVLSLAAVYALILLLWMLLF
jgi:hypothetical protein